MDELATLVAEGRMTPGQARVAAATAARMRGREERYAAVLRERGWLAIPPEYVILTADTVTIKGAALSAGAGRE